MKNTLKIKSPRKLDPEASRSKISEGDYNDSGRLGEGSGQRLSKES